MKAPTAVARPPPRGPAAPRGGARSAGWLAGAVIVLAALGAYHGSFSGPFVLDDIDSILGNPTIRHLWPIGGPLSPPHTEGLTVEGRPLLNLSFAVNYAISGTRVWSYHAVNLLIHVLAGLTLFGIVRRTLARRTGASAAPAALRPALLAGAVALLWTVHPLQTEAVTYIVQRAESLMGLFYLLALYGFIRGADAGGRGAGWFALSWLACLSGMATKEVMVSAPVIVLLYDRTFLSGSFREAWRRRWRVHLALAACWILLGWLAIRAGNRGGTSGFGVGADPAGYWLAQFPAVVRYLGLAVWPRPLIFDYGPEWIGAAPLVLPCALLVLALAAGTVWALWRRPPLGFLAIWFFAILAPTSLVPGNRQTLAEQRMYLALAPVLIALVLGLDALGSAVRTSLRARAGAPANSPDPGRPARLGAGASVPVLCAAAAVLCVGLTDRRNRDYRSAVALYTDNVAKLPTNPYAQGNLGAALFAAGRVPEAAACDEEALRLKPAYPDAEDNLANALLRLGRVREAVGHYERALRLDPGFADAHSNLAGALARLGRFDEAAAQCRQALRLRPDDVEAWNNLGNLLAMRGQTSDAVASYEKALRLDPDYPAAHYNLANALWRLGRLPEAAGHYRAALRLRPDFPQAAQRLERLEDQAAALRDSSPAPSGAGLFP